MSQRNTWVGIHQLINFFPEGHLKSFYDVQLMYSGFEPTTGKKLFDFQYGLYDVVFFLVRISIFLQVFAILFNIPHIFILSRKSMRVSSTNVVMIGIAGCDMCYMTMQIYSYFQENVMFLVLFQSPANNEVSYSTLVIKLAIMLFNDFARRCTPWLVIYMAAVRAFAIMNVTNPKFDFLSTSKCGWAIILHTIVCSFLIGILHFFTNSIGYQNPDTLKSSDPNITIIPEIFIVKSLTLNLDGKLWLIYEKVNELYSKVIPSVLFPILTIMLLLSVSKQRRAMKNRSGVNKTDKNSDRSARLVIYMTVSFMIFEMPQGLSRILYTREKVMGFRGILLSINELFQVLSYINSATHAVLCFWMSTQYRTATKEILRIKPKTTVHRSSGSTVKTGDIKMKQMTKNQRPATSSQVMSINSSRV